MKLYVGIDLHSNNSYIVILGTDRQVVYKGRLVNDPDVILQALSKYKEDIEGVVVESTYNWYWLVDGLKEAGYQMHLANPADSSKYCTSKYTDDSSDAKNLAELLRDGKLKEGYIYPKESRGLRELLRKRMGLMQHHTSVLLSLQSLLVRYKNKKLSAAQLKKRTWEELSEFVEDNNLKLSIKAQKSILGELARQIDFLEKEIMKQIKSSAIFKRIKTIPGIGDILGMVILLETADINRFSSAGNYASYCRCVKSEKISNGKKKGENNRKNGNKYLSWAFIEAANYGVRFNKSIQRYYQRKLSKRLRVVALKSIAAKLAKACYFIMKEGQEFDVDKSFV